MKAIVSIALGLALLAGAAAAVMLMVKFRPEAKKIEAPRLFQTVEVVTVKSADIPVRLPSQGIVTAERTTTLASEVAGRVAHVAERFKVGERFAKDDVLVELDAADYGSAVTQAEAAAAEARVALATEQARVEQAVRDWNKLSPNEKPSDLVLRKPQRASAEARVRAADDAVFKAKRDLERTKIRAPFDGRLKATFTEIGSFLTVGGRVAEMESTGRYEVRLPLSLEEYAFVPAMKEGAVPEVSLETEVAGQKHEWNGKVVRIEGEVDRSSRSVYLVAELEEGKEGAQSLLQPGLFLHAQVQGGVLRKAWRVPRRAFLDDHQVLVVKPDNHLTFRSVKVARADGNDMLVVDGLQDGERVCLTMLAAPLEGMEVRVAPSQAEPSVGTAP